MLWDKEAGFLIWMSLLFQISITLQEQFHYSNGTPNLTQNNQFITPSPGVLGAQVAPAPKRNGHIGIRETPTPTPLQRFSLSRP